MNLKLLFIFIFFNKISSELIRDELIISLSCNKDNIKSLHKVLNSILEQNVVKSLYKILLIFSKKDIKEKFLISEELFLLINSNKIRIIYINNEINLQTRLTIAINEYPKNPILIIDSNMLFPEGWLDMLIHDHKKHPNDVIVCSIQYYFGKDLTIKGFSEGFRGKYFGVYNHISDMLFNFAIINTDLGGTLFPPGIFKNKNFFNDSLFLDISSESDEFWQSCFIILEDRNLRQSSKIYDYTEYLINNYAIIEKKKIFEKIKAKFINFFQNFGKIVELRQKKIIISFTSYFQRFGFLTNVIESIKSQNFSIEKIFLFLYEKDYNKYNLNLTGVEVIKVNKDLKSHKKYYYAMNKFKNYAIITIDDDIYYPSDSILKLYESYISHPNIISGRRTHLIKYKKNQQIDGYFKWQIEQKKILNPDYNLFITTGAGAIYPPDILNIEEKYENLINETITTDDITLKYYEINKGIESIWVPNKLMLGMAIKKVTAKVTKKKLYTINHYFNDININKLNIDISNKILKNCCFQYKNIKTGLIIYLFNINNIIFKNENITFFDVDAYSFCPINNKIQFQIEFNESIAYCSFNVSYSMVEINKSIHKTKKILKATCKVKGKINNFEEYNFPVAKSNYILYINAYNKKKYICLIYKYFFCKYSNKCIMIGLSYKNIKKGYKINININYNDYICKINNEVNYLNDNIPIISKFICKKQTFNRYLKETLISGVKFIDNNKIKIKLINDIPNRFIISNIYIENKKNFTYVLIKGQLYENLIKDINDLSIVVTYPKLWLTCNLKNSSKYVLSNINCYTKKKLKEDIIIENQIVYDKNYKDHLLILNEITLFQNYEILSIKNNLFSHFFIKMGKIIYDYRKEQYFIFSVFLISLKYIIKIYKYL